MAAAESKHLLDGFFTKRPVDVANFERSARRKDGVTFR
jgi:hypothetical protein